MLCTQAQGETADQSYNLEVVSMRRTGDVRQPARHVVVSLVRLAKSLHSTAEATVAAASSIGELAEICSEARTMEVDAPEEETSQEPETQAAP